MLKSISLPPWPPSSPMCQSKCSGQRRAISNPGNASLNWHSHMRCPSPHSHLVEHTWVSNTGPIIFSLWEGRLGTTAAISLHFIHYSVPSYTHCFEYPMLFRHIIKLVSQGEKIKIINKFTVTSWVFQN